MVFQCLKRIDMNKGETLWGCPRLCLEDKRGRALCMKLRTALLIFGEKNSAYLPVPHSLPLNPCVDDSAP